MIILCARAIFRFNFFVAIRSRATFAQWSETKRAACGPPDGKAGGEEKILFGFGVTH
jgi:hypothetical protein